MTIYPILKISKKKNSLKEENNKDNKKNIIKNENKLRNNTMGSSFGNTTLSSLTKNLINPGKQSIFSTSNNILNSSRHI